MKLFNTLTRRKEEFVPLEEGKVRMYVCGPTVYNLIHIGNARPMIIFDTVRRYMEYKGYEVNYVSNFTDVDDKIIKKAIEEGVSAQEISERYIAECKKDMDGMNVKPATTNPQATQEIDGMISMIQTLVDKGYAYPAADGTVYFRVKKFKEYGKLSHKNLDDLQSGFRSLQVSGEDQKEDPLDFVLWKPKKEGEPFWESPWCQGRPGWHIECSEMSKKYLGESIDIHAGGEDLIFPHHECEIAQSVASQGDDMVHYWMHNNMITINGTKMGKSLGNFITLDEFFNGTHKLLAQAYTPMTIRFFILQAHYRSTVDFSNEALQASEKGLQRLIEAIEGLDKITPAATTSEGINVKELRAKCYEAMNDDLNTPIVIAQLFEGARIINNINAGNATISAEDLKDLKETFHLFCFDIMGLKEEKGSSDGREAAYGKVVDMLLEQRMKAKANKDWATSDEIRISLSALGFEVKDTKDGFEWRLNK